MADTRIYDGVAADNDISTATNWSDDTAPITGDTAIFPAMVHAATTDIDGSDFSAVLLAELAVESGCGVNFGSRGAYLEVDTDAFSFAGSGQVFLNIENCGGEIRIANAASASTTNSFGFNLIGASNTGTLIINPGSSGSIGIAPGVEETAAFTTIMVMAGSVTIGDALTCTTLTMMGGTVKNGSDVTTVNVYGGTYTQTANNPTTLNIKGGRVYYNSADIPTTTNLYAGTLDMSGDGRAKVFTTINWYGGNIYDPGNVLSGTTINWMLGGTRSA